MFGRLYKEVFKRFSLNLVRSQCTTDYCYDMNKFNSSVYPIENVPQTLDLAPDRQLFWISVITDTLQATRSINRVDLQSKNSYAAVTLTLTR